MTEPLDPSGMKLVNPWTSQWGKVIDFIFFLSITVCVTCIWETVLNDTMLTAVW